MRIATSIEFMNSLQAFIDNCIDTNRKERFKEFCGTPKGIEKWISQIDHFQKYLDTDKNISVADAKSSDEIIKRYRLGREIDVFVLSTLTHLRGVVLPCEQAISEAFKQGNGTIICSLSGRRFFFYFGEEEHAQYLFREN